MQTEDIKEIENTNDTQRYQELKQQLKDWRKEWEIEMQQEDDKEKNTIIYLKK